jgi:pyruvate dehydrogenase E1 component
LNSIAFPTVRSYDPAFGHEITVIVLDGMKRLYEQGEDGIYYLTVGNETYQHPPMPAGSEEGIIRGIYPFSEKQAGDARVQLFGSGAILREVLRAQDLLAEKYNISSKVWSVTSYTELRRDAHECDRWNMFHPTEPQRVPYIAKLLEGHTGPFIAASDYVRAVTEQVSPYVPGGLYALGTDGFGRSETRQPLRRHFEVDAECVTIAALHELSKRGQIDRGVVAQAIRDLDVNPDKIDPMRA